MPTFTCGGACYLRFVLCISSYPLFTSVHFSSNQHILFLQGPYFAPCWRVTHRCPKFSSLCSPNFSHFCNNCSIGIPINMRIFCMTCQLTKIFIVISYMNHWLQDEVIFCRQHSKGGASERKISSESLSWFLNAWDV